MFGIPSHLYEFRVSAPSGNVNIDIDHKPSRVPASQSGQTARTISNQLIVLREGQDSAILCHRTCDFCRGFRVKDDVMPKKKVAKWSQTIRSKQPAQSRCAAAGCVEVAREGIGRLPKSAR